MSSSDSGDDLIDAEELLLGGEQKLKVVSRAPRRRRQRQSSLLTKNGDENSRGRQISQGTHAASFQIEQEDHTLGNSLRYFINKNPDVEFCGYTIPHPSETKMNIRIQTWGKWSCHGNASDFQFFALLFSV